ncbi:MAG TPA: hypothetical protein VGS06_33070 [Streptosporangiaceae bacterium]|nr:hypothetical protein [Streptosporangiaceae bacterium]
MVFKYAQEPFDREHLALALAARGEVPVPRLLAAQTAPGILAMLLEDLGQPIRDAGQQDAAKTAVSTHGCPWSVPGGCPASTKQHWPGFWRGSPHGQPS